MLFYLILLLTPLVQGYTRVYSDSASGLSETCFSKNTSSTWAVRQWMFEMTRLPHSEKFCLLNTEEKAKYTTDEDAVAIIESMIEVGKPVHFTCTDLSNTYVLGVEVKAKVESFSASSIDCKDYTKIRPLSENKPGDAVKITDVNPPIDSVAELREELSKLKAHNDKALEENLRLATRLDHELTKARINDQNVNKTLEELERTKDEIQIKRERIKEVNRVLTEERRRSAILQEEIDNMKNIERQRTNEVRAAKPSMLNMTMGAVTMMALLSTSSSFVLDQHLENHYPHYQNRPGSSKYTTPEVEDSTCGKIDYGVSCKGFQFLMTDDQHGFTQAHYHKYTPLEALADGLVSKADGFCNVDSAAAMKTACSPDSIGLSYSCPPGFRGLNFFSHNGKLHGFTCKAGYEVSKDCRACVKSPTNESAKSSISLQDVVCQEDSSDPPATKLQLKDYCFIGKHTIRECGQYNSRVERMPFVIFKSGDKKYVDSLITRSIEIKHPSNFICYQHNEKVGDTGGKTGISSFKASECQAVNTEKTTKCTGDSTFCSMYACSKDYSSVFCVVARGAGIIEVKYAGGWLKPKCVGYETVRTGRVLKQPLKLASQHCDSCYSECQEDGILVRSTGFKISSVVACSQGVCITKTQDPATNIVVPYPGMMASTGGQVGLNIAHDDNLVSDKLTVSCPPKDPCIVHDCIICTHGLINYQCHTVLSALVVVSVLGSLVVASVMVLCKILQLLKVIPKHFIQPFRWTSMLLVWCGSRLRMAALRRAMAVNREIGWQRGEERVEIRNNRRIQPIPRYSVYMAIILLLPLALCCSETEIASSKLTKCRLEGNKEVCRIHGSVLVQAGPIGSETCLLLKAPSESKKKFISIKTVSSELVCLEGQSFWTAQYSPACMSSRRCRFVGDCTGNTCLAWNETKVSGEFAGMTVSERMTENKCFEQCGGMGCGCFSIYPSCLFVHSYLKPVTKEAFKVFGCVEWSHRITFEVQDFKGHVETMTLNNLNSKFTDWGSISVAIDAEVVSGTNSYSFMKSSANTFAIIDEQFSDIPREGYVGEIRCSSEVAASSAHVSCIRAPNIIKYKPMTDQIDCTSNLINPVTVFTRGSLPQVREGKTFTATKDKTGVQALINAKIQAAISLTFEDFDVEFETITPTCTATFLNITGCYSCTHGSPVCVRVKMSTAGTFTASSKDGSVNFLVSAASGSKDYCRSIHLNTPDVDIPMMYTCGGEEKLLEIKGTLISVGPIDDRETEGGGSTVINPKEGEWSISSWFSGLMKWMGGPILFAIKMLLLICGSILLVIIIFILLKFLIMFLLRRRIQKKFEKEV
ncbi:glycoprotein precursor [Embossos virus]|uniref:Envelopment polyprotein n=1 Tax=Embossos virus TaxID=2767008 RepID=A0A7G8PYJ5_9VIRU|nr:glycoprotein precursor [Embossos virus]QNJ99601.1 glycoprotein precursor [Embossos virus]